jgi:hypothetical protein
LLGPIGFSGYHNIGHGEEEEIEEEIEKEVEVEDCIKADDAGNRGIKEDFKR